MSDFKTKMHQNVLAGALRQTPLGELTALPRPISWILGGILLRKGREKEEKGRRGGKGRPPALLLRPQPLHSR